MRTSSARLSLIMALASSLTLAACASGEFDMNIDVPQESQKTLEELLATPWEEMTEADRDKLALLTGEMSPAEYSAKYRPDEEPIFGIFDAGKWERVDIPGAVCGNGSQYRIFIMRAAETRYKNNLTVYLEPGGACWDYESCSGQGGIRGAANPNGVPKNYMSFIDYINPFKSGGSPMGLISPIIWKNNPTGDNIETSKWNKVFIPYCTGDVHSGNRVAVYADPTGKNPPLTFHHVGAVNVEKVIDYLKTEFGGPDRMLVTGCSAGGAGALTNYHFFRQGLRPNQSYLLNDSGPIFPAPGTGNQFPLQQHIQNVWNLDYITSKYERDGVGAGFSSDYGQISSALAQFYPNDPLAITLFKRDGNYSAYSYARFWNLDENDPVQHEQILTMWAQDVGNMVAQYDRAPNLHYFIPYMRNINESHCTTIINWTGTEIDKTGIDVGNYVKDVIDGGSVTSFEEAANNTDKNVTDLWQSLVKLFL